ncbi:MAG TPA: rod shape-determining protein MreC, partial [Mycobacteriales bacterium]|nr:rod shape-determining protein MreC [Mycobacteriales bacterium]
MLLLLVLTAITLVTLDERGDGSATFNKVKGWVTDTIAPVQSAVGDTLQPVGDFFAGALHYGDLKRENADLRNQLAAQSGARLQAQDALRENQALKDLQKLDFVGDVPTVSAEVVSTTASNFDLTVELDRGTDDGIAANMPVVASAGLVGRVVRVSRSRSTVLLLTDPGSSVGIRVSTTGSVGVATGNGPGQPL